MEDTNITTNANPCTCRDKVVKNLGRIIIFGGLGYFAYQYFKEYNEAKNGKRK